MTPPFVYPLLPRPHDSCQTRSLSLGRDRAHGLHPVREDAKQETSSQKLLELYCPQLSNMACFGNVSELMLLSAFPLGAEVQESVP